MTKEVIYKNSNYKQMLKNIAYTSKYHIYEVEDVLQHFMFHIQEMLARGIPVKLPGVGTIKIQKMHVKKFLDGENLCYTTHRLSIPLDNQMKSFLKEKLNATKPTEATD